jgi:hypothetical protein
MSNSVADVGIPDRKLAREVTQANELLFLDSAWNE